MLLLKFRLQIRLLYLLISLTYLDTIPFLVIRFFICGEKSLPSIQCADYMITTRSSVKFSPFNLE